MAIERVTSLKEVSFSPNYVVFVLYSTVLVEDGVTLAETFRRDTIVPGDDYSSQPPVVQAMCAMLHTPENTAAFNQQMQASVDKVTGGTSGN